MRASGSATTAQYAGLPRDLAAASFEDIPPTWSGKTRLPKSIEYGAMDLPRGRSTAPPYYVRPANVGAEGQNWAADTVIFSSMTGTDTE